MDLGEDTNIQALTTDLLLFYLLLYAQAVVFAYSFLPCKALFCLVPAIPLPESCLASVTSRGMAGELTPYRRRMGPSPASGSLNSVMTESHCPE